MIYSHSAEYAIRALVHIATLPPGEYTMAKTIAEAALAACKSKGFSTAVATLRRLGVAVYDADAEIHKMLGPGGIAVAAVDPPKGPFEASGSDKDPR